MFVWSSSDRDAVAAFFDGRTGQWRTVATPRFEPGSGPVFARVAGAVMGWGESTIGDKSALALTFTTRPDWWATLARPPVAPDHEAGLVAGNATAVAPSSRVFFDVLAGSWDAVTPLPEPAAHGTASSAWTANRLFVWHGESRPGDADRA